jgi:hypothetical protein
MIMKSSLLKFAAVAVFAVGMIGCSAPADNTNAGSASPAATKETKATDIKPAATPATTASADKIGVAECDDYLEKYETCIKSKVPASVAPSLEASITATRNSWKSVAANPQTKGTLAAACTSILEATKKSTASYNCTW